MPSEIVVTGTARSYNPKIRDLLERRMGELAHAQAAAFGCTAEVVYKRIYPALINHVEQTAVSVAAAAALVGTDKVHGNVSPSHPPGRRISPSCWRQRPGGMVFIGNGMAPDGSFHNVHTPGFNFNDDIITAGRRLLGAAGACGVGWRVAQPCGSRAGAAGGGRRNSRPSTTGYAGEIDPGSGSTPTEQPPGKLSGNRDRIVRRSGERCTSRAPTEGEARHARRGELSGTATDGDRRIGFSRPVSCRPLVVSSISMPHIAIIGAGITGVTTAYALLDKGYDVTVFDRHRYAAMETSFANGGQLSASNAEVWNSWSTVLKGLKWLGRRNAPLLMNPSPSWHKYAWLTEFTAGIPNYRRHTVETTRLAIAARQHLFDMAAREGIDFNHETLGILHVYRDKASFDHASRVNLLLNEGGLTAARF